MPDLLIHLKIGSDLNGNTFWEFKESWNASRLRRIAKYNPQTHYADVKVTRTSSTHHGAWKHSQS